LEAAGKSAEMEEELQDAAAAISGVLDPPYLFASRGGGCRRYPDGCTDAVTANTSL
jgi:hypothetical protein